MYRVMLVTQKEYGNPVYGMSSIHRFNSREEAFTEAEFLEKHLHIPFFVSVNDQLENSGNYPYLTVAIEK